MADELHDLHSRVLSELEKRFNGREARLSRAVSLSQSTVNRTLNLDSSYQRATRIRNLQQILFDLGSTEDEEGDGEAKKRTRVVPNSNGIRIPTVAFKASAGDGTYALEEETLDTYVIDKDELPPGIPKNGIFRIEVEGNSMMPDLVPGEFVLVQRTPAGSTIRTDSIYLIRLEELIMLKALQRLPGRKLRIISRNETYENYTITLDAGVDFEVIGRVWGRFERLG